jgi:hypothetical protein
MNELAGRIAAHVLTFAGKWQLHARYAYDVAVKLSQHGAATSADVDRALLQLDLATMLVGVSGEVVNAALPPGPPQP